MHHKGHHKGHRKGQHKEHHKEREKEDRAPSFRGLADWRVDQVFLRRRANRITAQVSLVSRNNELRYDQVYAPTNNPEAAIVFTARHLARSGRISRAKGVRIRWEHEHSLGQDLVQDLDLETIFVNEFEAVLDLP